MKPSKFDAKKHCKQVIDLFAEGKDYPAFCSANMMGKSAFYDWIDTYPEFAQAVEIARIKQQEWWEEKGREGLNNKNFNPGVYQIMMTNKFRYTKSRTIKISGLSKAKNANGKMKAIEKEAEAGELTPEELAALGNFVSTGATVNEKTTVAEDVKELMNLVKK